MLLHLLMLLCIVGSVFLGAISSGGLVVGPFVWLDSPVGDANSQQHYQHPKTHSHTVPIAEDKLRGSQRWNWGETENEAEAKTTFDSQAVLY